jgi:hypothetical protein
MFSRKIYTVFDALLSLEEEENLDAFQRRRLRNVVFDLGRLAAVRNAKMAEGMYRESGFREHLAPIYHNARRSLREWLGEDFLRLEEKSPADAESLIYRQMAGCSLADLQRWCDLWASRLDQQEDDNS